MYRFFMNNKKFIGRFALWSIGIACLHFALETLFTLRLGQAFVGLLPDYLAVVLLIWGGLQVRKDNAALGLLCGAWGFTFVFTTALGHGALRRSWPVARRRWFRQPCTC